MADFEEFLARLLGAGEVVFRSRPEPPRRVGSAAVAVVREAYAAYALELPGAAVPLDARVACEAAEAVRQACWAMVSRAERPKDLARRVRMGRSAPRGPSDHASSDLFLRYLPRVHRRARAADPADPLVGLIADLLRRWPLSGVLAGMDDPPLVPPDFAGHRGLALLYAERFAAAGRPGWEPTGPAREFLDLVRPGAAAKETA
jgi:hypothetical protein